MHAQVFGEMASALQPKERIPSITFLSLAARTCTVLSYRKATEMLNLFFRRDGRDSIKLRTLSDMVGRAGDGISRAMAAATGKILKMHGFHPETGLPMEGAALSPNVMMPQTPEEDAPGMQALQDAVDTVNACREEK